MGTKTVALNPKATFHIRRTFPVTGRQSIVFEGEIISGTINAGQKIKVKPTDHHPHIELTISSVEFVDRYADKTGNVGLMVRIENAADLTDLLNYRIRDEECEIV